MFDVASQTPHKVLESCFCTARPQILHLKIHSRWPPQGCQLDCFAKQTLRWHHKGVGQFKFQKSISLMPSSAHHYLVAYIASWAAARTHVRSTQDKSRRSSSVPIDAPFSTVSATLTCHRERQITRFCHDRQ